MPVRVSGFNPWHGLTDYHYGRDAFANGMTDLASPESRPKLNETALTKRRGGFNIAMVPLCPLGNC